VAAIKNISTPDLGGATDVTVIEVLVKPGDKITKDASIVTLESDKATLEVPTTDSGIVKEVKVKVGDTVSTGTVLLTLTTEAGEAMAAAEKVSTKKESKSKGNKSSSSSRKKVEVKDDASSPLQEKVDDTNDTPSPLQEKVENTDEQLPPPLRGRAGVGGNNPLTGTLESTADIHAGPGVRRFARELGVDLTTIQGSGPKQRIIKEDIQQFVKTKISQSSTGATGLTPFSALPPMPTIDFSQFGAIDMQVLSRIKKISGKNLQRNWMMIPHVTQFGEADISILEDFRQSQKASMEKQNVKLTPLVFVMKAVVASLRAFPTFNASLDAAGENLIIKKYYNVGVAVDTPDGLVVPVIRHVDKKGLMELAKELAEVSEKARKKKLTPGDMQGGCFSISSLGGIGGTAFTPIINSPEVAILGVSKSSYKPVYQDGEFVPRLMLPLSLSYDHRVIDGADGARFIVHLTEMLSDIRNLLL
jgi:pyruvate dehydrogenase E2 component (dihydrolipoamide acetyltransferase)